MKKLLFLALLAFTLSLFVPAVEAGTSKSGAPVVKAHKKHRKHHHKRHRHHHRAMTIVKG